MALRKCTDRNRIWNGLLVNSCIKTLFCKLNFNLMAIAFLQVIIRGRRPLPATLFNPFFKFPFPPFPIVGFTSPPPPNNKKFNTPTTRKKFKPWKWSAWSQSLFFFFATSVRRRMEKKNQSWLLHMESFFQQQTVTSVTATFYSAVVCLPHKFLPCCHLYLCLSSSFSSLRCSSGSPHIRRGGVYMTLLGFSRREKLVSCVSISPLYGHIGWTMYQ